MSGYSDMDELPFRDWREADGWHVTDVTHVTQQHIVFAAPRNVDGHAASPMSDIKQIPVTGGPGVSGDAGAQAGRERVPGPRAKPRFPAAKAHNTT